MSYLIYINGQLVDAPNLSFAQTKQVNDIANLTTRQSNFTQTIKIPRTAKNKRIFDNAFNVGSQSNVPYTKATCDIIDSNTGQHVIYKGWAVLLESSDKDYNVTVYDGIIDFYRSFENVTITDIGITELNHIKTLASVVDTWNDTSLPYRYILADYNGNNDVSGNVNIDFQVPSAKVKYIWDKVFEFIGYTYTGSIFNHEKFTNLWLSYPKPISVETPITTEITEQTSEIVTNTVQYPFGGGTFFGSSSQIVLFPNANGFDPTYYNTTSGTIVAGLYRFSFSPATFTRDNPNDTSSRLQYIIFDTLNQITNVGYLNIQLGGYIDLNLNVGDRVVWQVVDSVGLSYTGGSNPFGDRLLSGETTSTMIKIDGYSLGFDEAFIDFKVSDFVREIMIRFGLTAFKDKYTNNVTFLTLAELLQNQNVTDLSGKFIRKNSEKYVFGNYAKSNVFRYKYNDDESKHNNGSFRIENQNLPEEFTILNSLIYSPESVTSEFLGGSNVYKIWDKEIKDDETVEYKGLDGRFYLLRADFISETITIGSEILGSTLTNGGYYKESYWRLPFDEILTDFYTPIKSIFDKARLIQAEFYFKPVDIYNYNFAKLVYIEQLGSYYIMNKISNFVKGKPTKCELIEVDYFTEFDDIVVAPIDYDVVIGEPTIDACEITLPITTNYELPIDVQLVAYKGEFNPSAVVVYNQFNYGLPLIETLSGGSVTFDLTSFPSNALGYKFAVRLLTGNTFDNIVSNISEVVSIDGSCYIAPDYPDTLTIDNVVNLGQDPNSFFPQQMRYNVIYSYTGMPTNQVYQLKVEGYGGLFTPSWQELGLFEKTEGTPLDLSQIVSGLAITKLRISVNGIVSNEFNV